MVNEIKEMFYDWSKDTLNKKKFVKLRDIELWANYVRTNPKKWKKVHTEFIDAIFDKHYQFRERLLKTPQGKRKLEELYESRKNRNYQ